MTDTSRNLAIDCLRGLSILIVIQSHGAVSPWVFELLPTPYSTSFQDIGYYGVVIFFTISGFLITQNTLRRYGEPSAVDFGQFYAMRVARVVPLLLLFLATMHLLRSLHIGPFDSAGRATLWEASYKVLTLQYNHYLLTPAGKSMFWMAPLWSLSIEELFYLLFPIACFLTRRRMVLIAILSLIVIGGMPARKPYDGIFSWWGCADLLAIGCFAALLKTGVPARTAPMLRRTGAVVIAATLGFIGLYQPNYVFAPTILALGAALFVIGASSDDRAKRHDNSLTSVLATFGRTSYEIYLFHVPVIMFLLPRLNSAMEPLGLSNLVRGLVSSVVLIASVLALGLLLSRYYTEPLNRKIRRYYETRARDVGGVVDPPARIGDANTPAVATSRVLHAAPAQASARPLSSL